MKKAIQHNLNVAKPSFISFIKNMNPELSRWIQYCGVEDENGSIIFKFKSSQNSLRFEVYGGVSVNNVFELLRGNSNEIYDFFKELKYEHIDQAAA
jgi:hypothetical protein